MTGSAPAGFGIPCSAHVVPFQCAARALVTPLVTEVPTAKQLRTFGHAMAANSSWSAPVTFGLVTIAHVVPFHCSMRVRCTVGVEKVPTAMQFVVVKHEMPASEELIAPAG